MTVYTLVYTQQIEQQSSRNKSARVSEGSTSETRLKEHGSKRDHKKKKKKKEREKERESELERLRRERKRREEGERTKSEALIRGLQGGGRTSEPSEPQPVSGR